MAYTIELVGESFTSGRNAQGRRRYQVHGTTDRATAYALAAAGSPTTQGGLIRQNVHIEQEGNDIWKADVQYGIAEQGEAGDVSWSFDIGSEGFHITNGLEHVASFVASGTAPDHKGAIGVRQDGSGTTVEGVDIKLPVFTWEETYYAPYSTVASYGFIQTLEATVARINDAAWRIWAKGELLLLGVSGAKRGEEPVGLTYRFAVSRTKTSMTIGDITGVDKEGHNYLWIEYEQKDDAAADKLTSRPLAVHVERVYDYADFTALGLPDPWA
jgi:hypothetical protein